MKNVAMSSVTGSGWTLCYNATYATATTSANINACKGAAYVLLPRPPTRRALAEARGIGEAGGLWHVLLLCVTWGVFGVEGRAGLSNDVHSPPLPSLMQAYLWMAFALDLQFWVLGEAPLCLFVFSGE